MRAPTMERPRPRLQQRTAAICASAAALFFLPPAPAAAADVTKAAEAMGAQELALPPLGGGGGGYFTARCPGNQYLAGVRLRVGDDVDAIQPLCVPYNRVDYIEREHVADKYGGYYREVEKSRLEPIAPYHDFIGGPGGGGPVDVVCKDDVVTGILVGDEGVYTRTVNRLGVFCEFNVRAWRSDSSGKLVSCEYSSAYRSSVIAGPGGPGGWELDPEAEFEGPEAQDSRGFFSDDEVSRGEADQHCPCGQAAVGITGRAGKWLDAVGLICGELKIPKAPLKASGRVKLPGTTPLPPLPICEAARLARERNSPAAPGLEAQCAAKAPLKAAGRVKLDAPPGPPAPARSICEVAALALARNSPAARGLAQQCAAEKNRPPPPVDLAALQARGAEIAAAEPEAGALRDMQGEVRRGFEIGLAAAEWHTAPGPGKDRIRSMLSYGAKTVFGPSEQSAFDAAVTFSLAFYKQKLDDFATRGAAIAVDDPLSAEFHELQADASSRRGFEIGLAAAEGDTAPGPGKQKIRGALQPAEQGGFDTAVAYLIVLSNDPDLARSGAAIAKADPAVGALRNSERDALYRLGFDFASGFFGDPALGGLGYASTGPGTLGFRDSLSPAGKRGFDAAANFNFARNYAH